ncbi:MAG: CRTAC1 family protein [Acidobacteriota bacterium]|nr:CRTAC1 family protein [Acidobacteriota bacterium]
MRRLAGCAAAALSLLVVARCASRPAALPTIEDYSDRVSLWAERFLDDWKAGAQDAALYAPGFRWNGPLPGDALAPVAARPPLEIRIYRAQSTPSPGGKGSSSDDLRRRLGEIRSRFAMLGRNENVLFEFLRRGRKREVILGLLLTGKDRSGSLSQEGGKVRAILAPEPDGSWRMESATLLEWISASASKPLYDDVTDEAGLARAHRAFRPLAAKSIPIPGEHFPPGVAVLDFDGDGREDLFVPGGDGNRLYRNMGSDPRRGSDPSFEDVAEKAGVAGQKGEGIGALAFDYDEDGDQDLYITYLLEPNLLYRNNGNGTFEEVGAKAGVALNDYSTSAAALDYDRDGDADLYVLVYGRPGRGPNVPANNAPPNHLYRNEGNGTFTDVSKESGADDTGWGLALQAADLDGDEWPDIYVANDFGVNAYYRNNRNGTFTDVAGRAGVKDAGFGMGVTVDDYDGDGRLDFYVSNYSFPLNWFLRDRRFPMPGFPYSLFRPFVWRRLKAMSRGSSLFRPSSDGKFERTSDEADVWNTSWSWGCVFVDGDLDGRADLFVVNGMATGKNPREREIDFWNLMSREYRKMEKGIATSDFGDDSLSGRPPKRFYKNLDGRRFAELAAVTGLESSANQRGAVVLDAEGDGDPDLFATGFLQRPALWVNRNPSGARTLVLTLQGLSTSGTRHRSTRDALGAVVTVEAGGLRRAQVVSAGYSFLSSGSKSLFFGLEDRDRANRVTIRWPSGKVSVLKDVAAGKLLLCEPPGDATTPIVR